MKKSIDILCKLITTLCFIGYFPIAPGTFASIIFSLVWFFTKRSILYYAITFLVLLLGFIFTGYSGRNVFKNSDPKEIVIDEASGILVAFLGFSSEKSFYTLISGILLFRAFDIFKPFPINKIEKIGGSAGIMLDDIFSGVIANALLHILVRFVFK